MKIPRLLSPALLVSALGCAPLWAEAARLSHSAGAGSRGTSWIAFPFVILLALGLQAQISRGLKAVAASASPLPSGELEIGGYARSVYGTPDREMLEVVGLGLIAGILMGVGVVWGFGLIGYLGFLLLLASSALDLYRWERVSVSAGSVWYQRGFWSEVQQVLIDNIVEVTVTEADARGVSLRHLNRNRRCRLSLRLGDNSVLALPKTDAYADLDKVEFVANQIRSRQEFAENREAAKRAKAGHFATPSSAPISISLPMPVPMLSPLDLPAVATQAPLPPRPIAAPPSKTSAASPPARAPLAASPPLTMPKVPAPGEPSEREMMRELMRLRQRAKATEATAPAPRPASRPAPDEPFNDPAAKRRAGS